MKELRRTKTSGYFSIMGNLDWIIPNIIPLLPKNYINQCEVTGGRGELLWHTEKPKGFEYFNDKDSEIIRNHITVQNMTIDDMFHFENDFNWILTKEQFDKLKKYKSDNDLEFLYQYLYSSQFPHIPSLYQRRSLLMISGNIILFIPKPCRTSAP